MVHGEVVQRKNGLPPGHVFDGMKTNRQSYCM